MATYNEPTWGTPQEAVGDCSSLVTSGPTPFIMTGILTRLLQYHFYDPRNVVNPQLRSLTWSNDCMEKQEDGSYKQRGLYIGSASSEDNNSVQASPSILVKRGAIQNQIVTNLVVPNGLNSRDNSVKGQKDQVTIHGKHSIICKGSTGAEASSIGEEAYFRFLNYKTVIRNDFRLGSFFVDGISDVQEMTQDSSKQFYVVVQLSWAYVYRWMLRIEAPQIKRTHFLYDDM